MRRPKKSGVLGSGNGWNDLQWHAVNSPHRMHLVSMLEALKKSTVAELAELTGRSQQSIYPHLKILVKAGLVRELQKPVHIAKNGRKSSSKTVPKLSASRSTCFYEFNPASFQKATESKNGVGLMRATHLTSILLHDLGLRCKRWGEANERAGMRVAIHNQNLMSTEITWFTNSHWKQFNKLAAQLMKLIRDARHNRKGQRMCIGLFQFPDVTVAELKHSLAQAAKLKSKVQSATKSTAKSKRV